MQGTTRSNPDKKRRRWLKVLLLILIAGLVLVALAPTIVSTAAVRRLALGQINSHINGRLSIDSWSLGWFSGVSLEGISLQDFDSQSMATIKNVSLEPRYLSLLGRNPQLGKINIQNLHLDVRFDRTSQTNLEKTIPSTSQADEPITKQPTFDLQLNNATVVIHQPNAKPISISNINSTVKMPFGSEPLSFQLSCDLAPAQAAGEVRAKGTIPRKSNGILQPELTRATSKITLKQIDSCLLSPFMQRLGLNLAMAGLLNIQTQAQINTLQDISVDCQASSGEIVLAGDLLKTDKPRLADFALRVQIQRRDNLLKLDALQLKCDLFDLQTKGSVQLAGGDKIAKLGSSNLKGQMDVDLAKIANQLPATLRLHRGLSLISGNFTTSYTLTTSDGLTELSGTAALQNLHGTVQNRPVQLDEPVQCTFDLLHSQDQGLHLRRLNVNSGFGQLLASGQANNYTVQSNLSLAKLHEQLVQFVDLGTLNFAGQLSCNATFNAALEQLDIQLNLAAADLFISGLGNLDLAGQLACDADVTAKDHRWLFKTNLSAQNLLIKGPGAHELREPQLNLELQGSLVQPKSGPVGTIVIDQANLLADQTQLQFSGQINPTPLAITGQAKINADLARLYQLASDFYTVPTDLKVAGKLSSTLDLTTPQINTLAISGSSTIRDLRLTQAPNRTLHQSPITLQHRVNYSLDTKMIDAQLPQVQLPGLSAQIANLAIVPQPSGQPDLRLKADFQAELSHLDDWMIFFGKLDAQTQLAGQITGHVSYSGQDRKDKFTINSQILNLQVISPSQPPFAEPKITVDLQGSANRSAGTFELSHLDIASNFVQATGKIFSGSAKTNTPARVDLQARCDLARLSRIAKAYSKDYPNLQGHANLKTDFTGPGAVANHTQWLNSLSGPATINFDQQSLSGITLGPAALSIQANQGLFTVAPVAIPANQGNINIQAQISPAKKPAFLSITEPINLAENIQINPELSNTFLKFVNPIFANNNEVSGSVNFRCDFLRVDDPANWKNNARMSGLFSGKDLILKSRQGLIGDLAKIHGLDFSAKLGELRPVRIALADGIITYTDMHIVFGPLLDLSFSGRVSLLDESINMKVGIPILPAMLGNRPELIENLGDQRIYLPITGTLSKPELDVTAFPDFLMTYISKALQSQISQSIGKILEDLLKPRSQPPPSAP